MPRENSHHPLHVQVKIATKVRATLRKGRTAADAGRKGNRGGQDRQTARIHRCHRAQSVNIFACLVTIVAAALRGRTCGSFTLALLPKVAASCKSWMAKVRADDVRSARPEAHTMEERSMQSMVDVGPPIPAGPRHRRQRGRGTWSFVRRTRTNLRKCGVRTPRKTMRRNA